MRHTRPLLLLLGTLTCSLLGCSTDSDEKVTLRCPDPEVFRAAVSPYLERRCGSLDCHGDRKRPLRIYGQLGQRHPAESNIAGGLPTTLVEQDANFSSVCGLEPELMGEVVDDVGNSAEDLLLISKPRGVVEHGGGEVIRQGDPADQCLTGWLGLGSLEQVQGACDAAVAQATP